MQKSTCWTLCLCILCRLKHKRQQLSNSLDTETQMMVAAPVAPEWMDKTVFSAISCTMINAKFLDSSKY